MARTDPVIVRHTLESCFYSRQYIGLTEGDLGRKLDPNEAMNVSIPFWKLR